MKTASLVAATLACVAFSAGPAAAQPGTGTPVVRSDTRGLGVGVQVNRIGLDQGRGSTVLGAGMGLTVSYGMTDAVSLFARAGTGYRSSHVDAGARYRFASAARALRPYVEAGVSVVGATRPFYGDDGVTSLRSRGVGATAGAGVEYYLNPRLALDLGVSYSAGRFAENEVTGLRDGFITNRVQMGITFRP
jgi:opacity protein-like surface antigen